MKKYKLVSFYIFYAQKSLTVMKIIRVISLRFKSFEDIHFGKMSFTNFFIMRNRLMQFLL
jgi:hypothetical protein